MYCKTKQACKIIVATAKRTKSQKLAEKVNSDDGRINVFRIAKETAMVGEDVLNIDCPRNKNAKLTVYSEGIKGIWEINMNKMLRKRRSEQ